MLVPNFSIELTKQCNSLIIKDITGFKSAGKVGGFGGGNINIEEITKVVLRMESPSGVRYEIFSTYLPIQGEWELFSKQVSDANIQTGTTYTKSSDCNCNVAANGLIPSNIFYWQVHKPYTVYDNRDCSKPNTLKTFPDGCTTITYELYAKTSIPVLACQYQMNTVICEGNRVFAKRNGGWYDITSQGIMNNLNYSFTSASTIDVFTDWEVRDEDGTAQRGVFSKYGCTSSGLTSSSPVDKMIASRTKTFAFTCNLEKIMAKVAFKLSAKGDCEIMLNGVNRLQAIGIFAVAHAKIHSIKDSEPNVECGCKCISDTINSSFKEMMSVVSLEKINV